MASAPANRVVEPPSRSLTAAKLLLGAEGGATAVAGVVFAVAGADAGSDNEAAATAPAPVRLSRP